MHLALSGSRIRRKCHESAMSRVMDGLVCSGVAGERAYSPALLPFPIPIAAFWGVLDGHIFDGNGVENLQQSCAYNAFNGKLGLLYVLYIQFGEPV
jgi:hypothetical protein